MEYSNEQLQPLCCLAHDLINKMSVIVGFCDLLNEKAQDDESAKRLALIHDIAESAAKELVRHQCQLQEALTIAKNARDNRLPGSLEIS
jgi:hypothetical protein